MAQPKIKKALPNIMASDLGKGLVLSAIPEYAQGLPIEIVSINYKEDKIVRFDVLAYPDQDHTWHELQGVIELVIQDLSEYDEWQCVENEVIFEQPSRVMTQRFVYERE